MVAITPLAAHAEEVRDRAGVTIREVSDTDDLSLASALLDVVWGLTNGHAVVPVGVLRAWAFTGNYVAAASLNGQLVGVSAAFIGRDHQDPSETVLHSHITGVTQSVRGHQVGLALKLHQRAWAAERGLRRITWTFDPLVRRNARFNLLKLGAEPTAYLEDFYGALADELNAGQSTDRMLVSWDVRPRQLPDCYRPGPGAQPILLDIDGRPQVCRPAAAEALLVSLPEDVEALRRSDPGLARAWRDALRGALQTDGFRLAGITEDSRYVLTRDD